MIFLEGAKPVQELLIRRYYSMRSDCLQKIGARSNAEGGELLLERRLKLRFEIWTLDLQ